MRCFMIVKSFPFFLEWRAHINLQSQSIEKTVFQTQKTLTMDEIQMCLPSIENKITSSTVTDRFIFWLIMSNNILMPSKKTFFLIPWSLNENQNLMHYFHLSSPFPFYFYILTYLYSNNRLFNPLFHLHALRILTQKQHKFDSQAFTIDRKTLLLEVGNDFRGDVKWKLWSNFPFFLERKKAHELRVTFDRKDRFTKKADYRWSSYDSAKHRRWI